MIGSRLRRHETRKSQKRIAISIIGSIALLVFLGIFGLRLLVGFSLLVDKIRGNTPNQSQNNTIIQPPVLDPLPQATASATLTLYGHGTANTEVNVYVNNVEYKKIPITGDGTFEVADIPVDEGDVTLYALAYDDEGNKSERSNTITTTIDRKPPTLEVTKPEDNAKIQDGTRRVSVEGKTDVDSRITINDRIVIVRGDGSFTYSMSLNDGDNILKITAIDPAGNELSEERQVNYQN